MKFFLVSAVFLIISNMCNGLNAMNGSSSHQATLPECLTYNLYTSDGQVQFYDDLNVGITGIDDESIFVGKHLKPTTPLIFAVTSQDEDLVSFILDNRPDVNKKDSSGIAPIHALTFNNDAKLAITILDNMLKQGLMIDTLDSEGKNMFHYLCRFGRRMLFDKMTSNKKARRLMRQLDQYKRSPQDYLVYCSDKLSQMYLKKRIENAI